MDESTVAPRITIEAGLDQALAAADNFGLRTFFQYWQSKRPPNGGVPQRSAIDPVEIPELLPSVFLADIEHGPQDRVRYRLIGTRIVEHEGADYTGYYLDEVNPDPNTKMRRHYAAACIGRVYLRQDTVYWHGRGHVAYRALLLPLADGGDSIDLLFGMMQFEN